MARLPALRKISLVGGRSDDGAAAAAGVDDDEVVLDAIMWYGSNLVIPCWNGGETGVERVDMDRPEVCFLVVVDGGM